MRLNQNVSFGQPSNRSLTDSWDVTSTDMELEVTPSQVVTREHRIPPLVPFIVNLRHSEMPVSVRGRVKVEGTWVDVGELRGVMEQHFGRW